MLKTPFFVSKSVNSLNKITQPLRKLGICLFNHDITFGEGRIAILADNEDFLNFYYKNEPPALFTDANGRMLEPNIYLHNYLNKNHSHYRNISGLLYKRFNFNSSIHFVEKEEDCQHLFSFFSQFDEAIFLQNAFNQLEEIKLFLLKYKKLASELISKAKIKGNQIILPYANDSSGVNFQSFLTDDKTAKTLKIKSRIILTDNHTKKPVQLTLRQSECLDLLAEGYTMKEIAKKMLLSPRTVEHYLERTREILNCRNTKELLAKLFIDKK
jgi:DNA-binding CsgD family transcriptional regulator